jgi:hypothetical protein
MERFWKSGRTCNVVKPCTGPSLSERSAVAIQEECGGPVRGEIGERWAAIRQIRFKCAAAWGAKECDSLLIALPCHLHLAATKLQVSDVDRHNFRNAQASAVEQFDQRRIAQC